MRIYLDDLRIMPEGFDKQVYSAEEAILLITAGTVTHFSFDHDLGDDDGTGYDVAKFVEECAYLGELDRFTWAIHSANPVGRKNIEAAMRNADEYWTEDESITNVSRKEK